MAQAGEPRGAEEGTTAAAPETAAEPTPENVTAPAEPTPDTAAEPDTEPDTTARPVAEGASAVRAEAAATDEIQGEPTGKPEQAVPEKADKTEQSEK
jgi:hypothetical protein